MPLGMASGPLGPLRPNGVGLASATSPSSRRGSHMLYSVTIRATSFHIRLPILAAVLGGPVPGSSPPAGAGAGAKPVPNPRSLPPPQRSPLQFLLLPQRLQRLRRFQRRPPEALRPRRRPGPRFLPLPLLPPPRGRRIPRSLTRLRPCSGRHRLHSQTAEIPSGGCWSRMLTLLPSMLTS